MALEELLERVGVEVLVFGDHLNDTGEIGDQVALVPVRQDGRYCRVVELDVLIVYFDKVNGGVLADQGY